MVWTCAGKTLCAQVRSEKFLVYWARQFRDRLKQIWMEAIEKHMRVVNLIMEMTLDWVEWKKRIHAASLKILDKGFAYADLIHWS